MDLIKSLFLGCMTCETKAGILFKYLKNLTLKFLGTAYVCGADCL